MAIPRTTQLNMTLLLNSTNLTTAPSKVYPSCPTPWLATRMLPRGSRNLQAWTLYSYGMAHVSSTDGAFLVTSVVTTGLGPGIIPKDLNCVGFFLIFNSKLPLSIYWQKILVSVFYLLFYFVRNYGRGLI